MLHTNKDHNTSYSVSNYQPLAFKARPTNLQDFIGQKHLIDPGKPIYNFLKVGKIPSMLFWGPPGTGKTTLAYIIAVTLDYEFYTLSAVMDGKGKLKSIIKKAEELREKHGRQSILFIDEIHRWNKAQQDALLPYIENGTLILIGATTENPSFTVINALLSRTQVYVFYPIEPQTLFKHLERTVKKYLTEYKVAKKALEAIVYFADGDVRTALNLLEMATFLADAENRTKITSKDIEQVAHKNLMYDKNADWHYKLISAVHKSIRASDGIAASYYIMRMLEAGEDPLYIARRLIRFASEDIGNSKPAALFMANIVYETCQKIGMPECAIFLIQLAMYLADAPKDNSAYKVESFVKELIKKYGNLSVPKHFRNAPTKLLKDLGYYKDYKYDHLYKNKYSGQQTWPDKLHELFKERGKKNGRITLKDLEKYIPECFRKKHN